MPAPSLSARRPEIVLAALLSLCLVVLSLQVRRPSGRTVGEGWLLDVWAPAVHAVSWVRGVGGELSSWSATRERLLRQNRDLTGRVETLEAELLSLRDAERDRTRLLELFGSHPTPPAGTRVARLIALESAGPFRSAILDRGASDGILANGVVVSPAGLLGRVVAPPGARTAHVQLLSDRTAAVGVLFVRGGRAAVARGDGKGGVTVQYVPAISDVAPDDLLVTSGTDGVYPRDLPVGRISAVRRGGHSLFLDLPVTVAADPARESTVFVLPPVLPSDSAGPPPGKS